LALPSRARWSDFSGSLEMPPNEQDQRLGELALALHMQVK